MSKANNITKTLFFVFLSISIIIFSGVVYLDGTVENEYNMESGEIFSINSVVPITAVLEGQKFPENYKNYTAGDEFNVNLKAFGIIPVSQAKIKVIDKLRVAVLGVPFGMRIYTSGVLISNITDVNGENGKCNPAKSAGLKTGDYIISVNGEKVCTNEDLSYIIENSNGQKLRFEINRQNKKIIFNINPVYDVKSRQYKLGIWVKDSSAGIGTLTFYSPSTNIICGLGHGVCDEESNCLLKIESGELVTARITDVKKGAIGSPGKLEGRFKYESIGDIALNCENGIFSNFSGNLKCNNLMNIALKQNIKNGDAKILCTVDGETPKYYSCKIELKNSNYDSGAQNMLVTVTDSELLKKTGGIVQGMSGSPLIQNGKLIGAITHVLVDDPTTGYAIFAENMLETAQGVASENKLKDAS